MAIIIYWLQNRCYYRTKQVASLAETIELNDDRTSIPSEIYFLAKWHREDLDYSREQTSSASLKNNWQCCSVGTSEGGPRALFLCE